MSGWITTFSGQRIKSTAVHSTQIDREDCTRGLAMQVRFLGQVRSFYSVAEHSILVADIAAFYGASKLAQQCALLHDGHEYITGDFPTPYKDDVEGLRAWERNIEIIFRASLGLPPNIDPVWTEIKRCDLVALHYEAHNLMGPNPGWIDEDLVAKVWPSWAPIRCLDWKEAATAFSAKASVLGLSGF